MKEFLETSKTAKSLTMIASYGRGGGLRLAPSARFQRLLFRKRLSTRLLAFTLAEGGKWLRLKKVAFTLAEVLIVIGIIGVIAAMTIPTLVQNHQEKVTVTRLKKVYSTLEQAFRQAVYENGTPDSWNIIALNSATGAQNIYKMLSPYLSIQEYCGVRTDTQCFAPVIYKNIRNGNWDYGQDSNTALGYTRFRLSDGTSMAIQTRSADCTENSTSESVRGVARSTCAFILVDINGHKSPNKWGEDLFSFVMTKSAIIPRGIPDYLPDSGSSFEKGCNLTSTASTGWGCAAWVIYNENMDYLHCDDLSWDGKRKCD